MLKRVMHLYGKKIYVAVNTVIFENEIVSTTSIWTALVAIPSCLYWIIYLILTYTSSKLLMYFEKRIGAPVKEITSSN